MGSKTAFGLAGFSFCSLEEDAKSCDDESEDMRINPEEAVVATMHFLEEQGSDCAYECNVKSIMKRCKMMKLTKVVQNDREELQLTSSSDEICT